MIEGVLRHDTEMDVEKHYVDTHGQSEVGLCVLPSAGLCAAAASEEPQKQRLYRPHKGEPGTYANLQPILTRPINWELIAQQYDELHQVRHRACGWEPRTPNRSCGASRRTMCSTPPTRRCVSWAKR